MSLRIEKRLQNQAMYQSKILEKTKEDVAHLQRHADTLQDQISEDARMRSKMAGKMKNVKAASDRMSDLLKDRTVRFMASTQKTEQKHKRYKGNVTMRLDEVRMDRDVKVAAVREEKERVIEELKAQGEKDLIKATDDGEKIAAFATKANAAEMEGEQKLNKVKKKTELVVQQGEKTLKRSHKHARLLGKMRG